MSDVPPAIVESPRPPLRPRPERAAALRKLIKTVVVVAVCIAGWRFLKWYTRSDRNKQLEARQDNSATKYPGIALGGTMKFLGHEVPLKVEPAQAIEFKYMQIGISMEGLSPEDVAGGVLEGTCKQAGYELLESLTTWKRPAPPPRADPVTECNQGFHCRENAEEIEDKDPATAAKLYASACEHDDEAACLRGADIEMTLTKGIDEHRAQGEMMLEMACARDLARTCTGAARIKLTPLEPGREPSRSEQDEALAFDLHGCDLGDSEGCEAAVPLLKGTPFADAAPLFEGAPTAKSKTLGTIIALRWGQWTQLDQGQATAWVTREPAHLPEGAIVTPFSGDRIPTSIHPPDGVGTVYAIALRGGNDRCVQCMPSGGGDSIYSMRAMSCVCAIAPKQ